jgi:hypothetical protein
MATRRVAPARGPVGSAVALRPVQLDRGCETILCSRRFRGVGAGGALMALNPVGRPIRDGRRALSMCERLPQGIDVASITTRGRYFECGLAGASPRSGMTGSWGYPTPIAEHCQA